MCTLCCAITLPGSRWSALAAKFCLGSTKSGKSGPASKKLIPDSAEIGPDSSHSRTSFNRLRPNLANTGANLEQLRTNCSKTWSTSANFGLFRPNSCHFRPSLAQFDRDRSTLVDFDRVGATSTNLGPHRENSFQIWAAFDRIWSMSAKFGTKVSDFDDQLRLNFERNLGLPGVDRQLVQNDYCRTLCSVIRSSSAARFHSA